MLFAEAVDGEAAKISRLSFSTKLTDYFASGKCIFAVGNEDTAPMEYLKNEDAFNFFYCNCFMLYYYVYMLYAVIAEIFPEKTKKTLV